jgi:hypothetical protein
MFVQRISCFSIVTALCAASVMLIAQGTSALSHPSRSAAPASFAHVDRTAKSDRLMRPRGAQSTANAVAIELSGPSDVVIRDHRGNIVFAVDHSARTTIVGKQGGRRLTSPEVPGEVHKPLPEGCEGAFSPYVEPSKAHILGRCLSFNVERGRAFS